LSAGWRKEIDHHRQGGLFDKGMEVTISKFNWHRLTGHADRRPAMAASRLKVLLIRRDSVFLAA
jgi:hypothetical protein